MASSLLTVEITESSVAGLLLGGDKRSLVVTDSRTLFFNDPSQIPEKLESVLAELDVGDTDCRVALSAEFFFFRTLSVPFVDRKQAAAVIGYELQDSVTLSEDAFISISVLYGKNENETGVLAVLLEKNILADILSVFRKAGIDPELITVSGFASISNHCQTIGKEDTFVLVELEPRYANLYMVKNCGVRLVRPIPFTLSGSTTLYVGDDGVRVEPTERKQFVVQLKELAKKMQNTAVAMRGESDDYLSVPWVISGRLGSLPEVKQELASVLKVSTGGLEWSPYQAIEGLVIPDGFDGASENCLALAGFKSRESESLNFRKDEFACTNKRKGLTRTVRLAAVAVIAAVVLVTAGLAIEFNRLEAQKDSITTQINAIYREAVPGGGRIVDAVQQLTVKVSELKSATSGGTAGNANYTTVLVLTDISKRIPKNLSVTFERFIYDRKTVRIKGLTDTFNTVDQMKRYLNESPLYRDVSIVSANVATKENGVKFELKLQL